MAKSDGIWVTKTGRIYQEYDVIETPAELQALLDDIGDREWEVKSPDLYYWGSTVGGVAYAGWIPGDIGCYELPGGRSL